MYPDDFQTKLEAAVEAFQKQNGTKPSLLQISREDFDAILPHEKETARFGLNIKGVTTIGLEDISRGQYFVLP